MVTMAQRIAELRAERNLPRPALSAELGFPRLAIEKFETGRQTPTKEQFEKLCGYFGVSAAYLRGESNSRGQDGDWMNGSYSEPEPQPAAHRPPSRPQVVASSSDGTSGAVLGALLSNPKFQEQLKAAMLDALRSPEGQKLLAQAIRTELNRQT